MKWGLKREINFFTLDELQERSEGILLLEGSYFKILSFTLAKGVDERERELEIEERLEEEFENYESFYYLDKEISIFEDEEIEKILIIMIERDKIYSLIDNLSEKKIKLLGIYPLFFMEFFNLDGIRKNYIEIEDEKTRIYTFDKNKLINFVELDIERDELYSSPQYLNEYLQEGENFIYSNEKEILEYFDFELRDWREYKLFEKRELDYLPSEYHEELKYKRNIKRVISFLSLVGILGALFFFTFQFKIRGLQEELNQIQVGYQESKERNIALKADIEMIEDEIKKVKEENREREFNKLKLSDIMVSVIEEFSNIRFSKLTYDGEGTLTVEGSGDREEDIYSFQKEMLKKSWVRDINQDFIKLDGEEYRFYLDIGVVYGRD